MVLRNLSLKIEVVWCGDGCTFQNAIVHGYSRFDAIGADGTTVGVVVRF